ncbi:UDP-3-O-acyl N-acetylglycosamine deacetylasefamily protein [Striga asiatica]|uniref:UDP-3-O-acyl N-acetylglycosamine deacetylasefamily protein n=1 Tax=Striga asiatica TaxID=4170 RepID=A0A5A7R064_STRAF|nr:UDP-3-O-acyl N-acetylglycosamine deacetylasefamily protein [Striga asiatica]
MARLLCWDKVARELVGKPCDADNDGSYLPLDLELLTHKLVLFKVSKKKDQFGEYNGPYTVSRLTADHILVNRFGSLANMSQDSNAEDMYSPIRVVKAEEVYIPIMAVNSVEVNSPIRAVKDEENSPIRAVKAEVNSPIEAVKGCKEDVKKREQTGSGYNEVMMGKKKIKIEQL